MKRAVIPIMLTAALILLFNGTVKAANEPYKVGAIFSVTGPASWLGDPEKKTVEMLVEAINKAGGINGHPLEVIIEDDEGNPDKAKAAAQKLILKDKVTVIIGPSTSGCSFTAKGEANDNEVPLISCAAAEKIVVPVEENMWIFKVPQTDADCARRIFECMKDLGLKKAGLLTDKEGFGMAGREQLLKFAKEYDIEVAGDETFAKGDSDLSVQLQKLKGAKVDAVIAWTILPVQADIAKQMKGIEFKAQLFQSHGYGNIKYVEQGGEAANGTIFPAGRLLVADLLDDDHPQKNVLVSYKKDYESKYGEAVSTFGGHAYDALMLVVEALKAVGPDSAKIRDNLETRNGKNAFIGTAGIFNITDKDHCGLDKNAFELITVKDGKFVPFKKEK